MENNEGMKVGHNSLTILPAEMSALTGLVRVEAGYNYLDCLYLKEYMGEREGTVVGCEEEEQYRLWRGRQKKGREEE